MGFLLWLSIMAPFGGAGYLWEKSGRKNFVHPLILLLGGAVIASLLYWIPAKLKNRDIEYWTGYAETLVYVEDYETTETRTRSTSNGGTETYTETVYHYPEYWVTDNNGETLTLDSDEYLALASFMGHANPPKKGFFPGSGHRHNLAYLGTPENRIVVTTAHHFQNRVANSDSTLFHFDTVTDEEAKAEGLYSHEPPGVAISGLGHSAPNAPWIVPCVQGGTSEVEKLFATINADLGHDKQVRIVVLVFSGKDASIADRQQAYWKNGKKNELVICVGIEPSTADGWEKGRAAGTSSGNLEWIRCWSWSESEDLKVEIDDYAVATRGKKPLVWKEFADFVRKQVQEKWVRRQFADFKYISTPTPAWAVGVCWLIMIIFTIVILWIAIRQDSPSAKRGRYLDSLLRMGHLGH